MLQQVFNMIFLALGTVGGVALVWGCVIIASALMGTHGQTSGADISPGIFYAIGGAIIIAVSALAPGLIDLSWAH